MQVTAILVVVVFVLANVFIERVFNNRNEVQLIDLVIRSVWFLGGYYAVPIISYLMNR